MNEINCIRCHRPATALESLKCEHCPPAPKEEEKAPARTRKRPPAKKPAKSEPKRKNRPATTVGRKRQFNVRVTEYEHEELTRRAAEVRMSLQGYVMDKLFPEESV